MTSTTPAVMNPCESGWEHFNTNCYKKFNNPVGNLILKGLNPDFSLAGAVARGPAAVRLPPLLGAGVHHLPGGEQLHSAAAAGGGRGLAVAGGTRHCGGHLGLD